MANKKKNHHKINRSNSKVIRLFSTFTPREISDLDHYLKSLYQSKKIVLLIFDYFRKAWSTLEEGLDLEQIYAHVYARLPEGKSEILNLRNSISDLYQHVLQYLIWKEMQYPSHENELLRLRVLQKRKLENDMQGRIKTLCRRLDKKKEKGDVHHLRQLQYKQLYYYATEMETFDNHSSWISEANECLDRFFITTKLKFSCELLSRKNLLQEQNEIRFLDEALEWFSVQDWSDYHLTPLYKHALQLITEKKESAFDILLDDFKRFQGRDKKERLILWSYLLNFVALQIRKGDASYMQRAFELYRLGLKEQLFTINGYFNTEIFLNFVNIGCTLKFFDEIELFIDRWAGDLKPEFRESTIYLARARLEFGLAHFEEAISNSLRVSFKNDTYNLQARLLELRSYFELPGRSWKKISRRCKQLEIFLKKNKTLHKDYLDSVMNFLKIFKQLNDPDPEKLLHQVKTVSPVMAKDWLLEKIEPLNEY